MRHNRVDEEERYEKLKQDQMRKTKRFVMVFKTEDVTEYKDKQTGCTIIQNFICGKHWEVLDTQQKKMFEGSFAECKQYLEKEFPDEGNFIHIHTR